MPTSRIAAMSSEVATGRMMNGRDGLTDWTSLVVAGCGCLVTTTGELFCSFQSCCWQSRLPDDAFDRRVAASATPSLMLRICALLFWIR